MSNKKAPETIYLQYGGEDHISTWNEKRINDWDTEYITTSKYSNIKKLCHDLDEELLSSNRAYDNLEKRSDHEKEQFVRLLIEIESLAAHGEGFSEDLQFRISDVISKHNSHE